MKCDELKAMKFFEAVPTSKEGFYQPGAFVDGYLKSEADKVIAELKDKCQMHDFFWEGCGFAKRGFKNTIAVSEAFDELEIDNAELKADYDEVRGRLQTANLIKDEQLAATRHSKRKRCLAMAKWCESEAYIHEYGSEYDEDLVAWFGKWHNKWLELAEKFKPNKEAK